MDAMDRHLELLKQGNQRGLRYFMQQHIRVLTYAAENFVWRASITLTSCVGKQFVFWVFIVTALFGYSKPTTKEGKGNDQAVVTHDDDGAPHPEGSFDYATIAPHPRLLFSAADEGKLKARLQVNADLMAIHEAVIHQCNAMLATSPLTRTMTGKRLLSVSRTALKRIFYLAYGYRMTGDERYLVRTESELNAVCAFSDWNPSHFLDVGEMALAVAIGYDWLFDELADETRHNIRMALRNKAFAPTKDNQYNWYLKRTNNWNQVCNAGIAFAAMATYEANKELAVEHMEEVLETITLPLQEYAPDGNYPEGYMYWSYGTSFQVMLLAAFESAFGTDNNLHRSAGFLNTAEYMLYMVGPSGQSFNYADSYAGSTPRPALLWLAHKQGDVGLLFNEARFMEDGGAYIRSFPEDRLLPTALIYANDLELSDIPPPTKKIWVGHGITPVAMVRTGWESDTDKYLGIKAGKANTGHGHMDAGSFVYESEGIRWALDLGYQNYLSLESKGIDLWNMEQNSQRWDVFRLSNASHNVLTVNGKRHRAAGKAELSEVFDTDAKRGATVDLTEVFRGELNAASREIVLIDDDYLAITDRLTTNNNGATVRWAMVTRATPEIVSDREIRLMQDGKTRSLIVDGMAPVTLNMWSTEPITDYDAENPGTVLVGFETELAPDNTFEFIVTLK